MFRITYPHRCSSGLLRYTDCERMGRIFLSHLGGSRIFLCASCETPLTNRAELISTRFTGATGRAFLFNRVVNLSFSEVQVFGSVTRCVKNLLNRAINGTV